MQNTGRLDFQHTTQVPVASTSFSQKNDNVMEIIANAINCISMLEIDVVPTLIEWLDTQEMEISHTDIENYMHQFFLNNISEIRCLYALKSGELRETYDIAMTLNSQLPVILGLLKKEVSLTDRQQTVEVGTFFFQDNVYLVAAREGVVYLCDSNGASIKLMSIGQFLMRCHQHDCSLTNLNLMGVELRGINLVGANLAGTDLSFAQLNSVNLKFANLCGVNLTGANLAHADLSYVKLIGADLTSAILDFASLVEANLQNSTLKKVKLTGADLFETNLMNADLREATLDVMNLATPYDVTFACINGAHFDDNIKKLLIEFGMEM